jgi:uncharacterized protein involved in cysteine biosynthesis
MVSGGHWSQLLQWVMEILHHLLTLMVMGIGFIATITAAVSSYFISSFSDKEITINELGEKLDKLEQEIKNLKKDLNDN